MHNSMQVGNVSGWCRWGSGLANWEFLRLALTTVTTSWQLHLSCN